MVIKGIIFDIDGTLADTLPMCVESFQVALERIVGRRFTAEEITSYFGLSEEGIIAQFASENLPEAIECFFEIFEDLHRQVTGPFPGILEILQDLRKWGIPLAAVTGKGRRGAEITVRMLGLEPYLDVLEAGFDDGPDKPRSLRRALDRLGLEPHEAVYVGDTAGDMRAAAKAGMQAIGAAWAQTATVNQGNGTAPLHVFHRVEDFRRWINETFAPGQKADDADPRS